jgi:Family of unknown function (DUF6152)
LPASSESKQPEIDCRSAAAKGEPSALTNVLTTRAPEEYIPAAEEKILRSEGKLRREAMKNNPGLSFLVMVGLLLLPIPTFAHHGNASYGHAKQITLKGTVTEWDWLSPHTLLKMDVKDEHGNAVNWIIEWSAPSSLINFGINKKTFKPGDEVTVVMITPDNGAPVGRMQRVMLANGTWLRG